MFHVELCKTMNVENLGSESDKQVFNVYFLLNVILLFMDSLNL